LSSSIVFSSLQWEKRGKGAYCRVSRATRGHKANSREERGLRYVPSGLCLKLVDGLGERADCVLYGQEGAEKRQVSPLHTAIARGAHWRDGGATDTHLLALEGVDGSPQAQPRQEGGRDCHGIAAHAARRGTASKNCQAQRHTEVRVPTRSSDKHRSTQTSDIP
jgi:hypothetical protein